MQANGAKAETPDAIEIKGLVERARAAQRQIANYTQEQVDQLIRAVVWSVAKPGVAEMIAKQTVEETQLGNYDGKFLKIFRKTRATLMDIIDDKSVGILEEDRARNIVKIAKPVGVIGGIAPSTNPEATPVIKAIHSIKGRNAIIVAPHPRAKLTNKMICDLMREAIVKMGAPADLVIGIDNPTLEKTTELMRQCDRVLATGGGAMVTAAYSSGKPALGVGVGNAVITVDDTADLDDAAEKIRISKTLDLAASCSADNSVILVDKIYDAMLHKLVQQQWEFSQQAGQIHGADRCAIRRAKQHRLAPLQIQKPRHGISAGARSGIDSAKVARAVAQERQKNVATARQRDFAAFAGRGRSAIGSQDLHVQIVRQKMVARAARTTVGNRPCLHQRIPIDDRRAISIGQPLLECRTHRHGG